MPPPIPHARPPGAAVSRVACVGHEPSRVAKPAMSGGASGETLRAVRAAVSGGACGETLRAVRAAVSGGACGETLPAMRAAVSGGACSETLPAVRAAVSGGARGETLRAVRAAVSGGACGETLRAVRVAVSGGLWVACVGLVLGCGGGGGGGRRDDAASASAADAMPAGVDASDVGTLEPPNAGEVIVPGGGGVASFYLDRDEVVIGEYMGCVDAKACTPPAGRVDPKQNPIAIGWLSLDEARAFCRWRGKRLPTLAEWQRAAFGNNRRFPWGNEIPTCEHARLAGCGDGPAAPGRKRGATPEGVRDLFGNVAEWVDPGETSFAKPCVDPPARKVAIVGGFYARTADDVRAQLARPEIEPGLESAGVRCARSPTTGARIPVHRRVAAIANGEWIVADVRASATEAMRRIACPSGELPLAGSLLGRTDWLAVAAGAATEAEAETLRTSPDQLVLRAPKNLTRVVGTATCQDQPTASLTVRAGPHTWKLDVTDHDLYQLWLPAGELATFTLACPPIQCSGATCAPGYSGRDTAKFRVPPAQPAGVVGPQLQRYGGCTCD